MGQTHGSKPWVAPMGPFKEVYVPLTRSRRTLAAKLFEERACGCLSRLGGLELLLELKEARTLSTLMFGIGLLGQWNLESNRKVGNLDLKIESLQNR